MKLIQIDEEWIIKEVRRDVDRRQNRMMVELSVERRHGTVTTADDDSKQALHSVMFDKDENCVWWDRYKDMEREEFHVQICSDLNDWIPIAGAMERGELNGDQALAAIEGAPLQGTLSWLAHFLYSKHNAPSLEIIEI
jgi:hypothetical protein